jgi:hypothetical protein
MKQQILEQRLAEVEAIARQAIKSGAYTSALLDIIKVTQRDKP